MKKITPLTPERRLEIYKLALEFIKKRIKERDQYHSGLCHAIRCVKLMDEPSPYDQLTYYPELSRFKPKNVEGWYWWECNDEGDLIRVEVLEKVIAKMEAKLKKTL